MKLALRQGDVEFIDLNAVLQGLRLLLAGGLHLLHLPSDDILKRAQLPGFQPSERLVSALQRKALPLMAALYRLALDAMTLGRIDAGIAPQGRDDGPQAGHPVEQRKDRPRRAGICAAASVWELGSRLR
jgi:hypothetical protein